MEPKGTYIHPFNVIRVFKEMLYIIQNLLFLLI